MTILLTNDDGIDASGLAALEDTVRACFPNHRIVVAAPTHGQSEVGHSIRTGRPIRVVEIDPNRFSIDATPATCVRVALNAIVNDVDFVLSGINEGANLGVDVWVSGTVAAAREASLRGVDAIAISHYRHPNIPRTWEHTSAWITPMLKRFRNLDQRTERLGRLWNVNLPAILPSAQPPKVITCDVDCHFLPADARIVDENYEVTLDYHQRPRTKGSDVDICFGGSISLSQIRPLHQKSDVE